MATCIWCGKEFATKHDAKYCSNNCRALASQARKRAARPLRNVTCPTCGKVHHPKRKDAVYCSDNCRIVAFKRRKRLKKNAVFQKLETDLPQTAAQITRLVHQGTSIEDALKAVSCALAEQLYRFAQGFLYQDALALRVAV